MSKSQNSDARRSSAITLRYSGYDLLLNPLLNKGTAFTESERQEFDLDGLLPPHISSLRIQMDRRLAAFRALPSDEDRHVFLRELQDTNEILFYALLSDNLEEMLPIVYTPTVGYGCQQFSRLFRRSRGLFLSFPLQERIKHILSHPRYDHIEAIVVTDGERVLGLGDLGVGGMGISIGKASIYTACAGLHPSVTLPVFLDVGTDNKELRDDPLYIGWRHERVRGPAYDQFIDSFVTATAERWPHVLLQWEDFAKGNAARLLNRHRDHLCSFNDDIQGTAAAATGSFLSAAALTGIPLSDQKICILGAGSAGCGIARLLLNALMESGLSEDDALKNIYLIDKDGLLTDKMVNLSAQQCRFTRSSAQIEHWRCKDNRRIDLLDVVENVHPIALIGVSGQRGAFTEAAVRAMAAHVTRPIIFPLSNPASCSEAAPADLVRWTDGRAIIGAGSPFKPTDFDGRSIKFDQINNTYIFPGVVLGSIACQAKRISDDMFLAAANALAAISPACDEPQAGLLPPIRELRQVAREIAVAVAKQAHKEGLAEQAEIGAVLKKIEEKQWTPSYSAYRREST